MADPTQLGWNRNGKYQFLEVKNILCMIQMNPYTCHVMGEQHLSVKTYRKTDMKSKSVTLILTWKRKT